METFFHSCKIKEEDHCAAMMFRCFVPSNQEERLFFRFGLLPRFKTRICLDLSLLDNRTI